MAAPAVVTTSTGEQATDSATHVITMPASLVAGNLLLIIFSCDCATGDSEYVVATASAGWTKGGEGQNGNFNCIGSWFYKISNGADSCTITTAGITATQQSTHICYQISGGYSISGTSAGSTGGSNSNPPDHTGHDGAQDYLSIATRSGDNTVVATAAPSGYGSLITQAATNTTGASSNSAHLALSGASSENPGTFTSASEQWVAWTLLVSPYVKGARIVRGDYYNSSIMSGRIIV